MSNYKLVGKFDEDSIDELYKMWAEENVLRMAAETEIVRQRQTIDIQKTTIARLRRKIAKLQCGSSNVTT